MTRIHRYYVYLKETGEILAVFHEDVGKEAFLSLLGLLCPNHMPESGIKGLDTRLKRESEITIGNFIVSKSSRNKKELPRKEKEELIVLDEVVLDEEAIEPTSF